MITKPLLDFLKVREWLLKQDGNALARIANNTPYHHHELKITITVNPTWIEIYSHEAHLPHLHGWIFHPALGYIMVANFETEWNKFVHAHKLWSLGCVSSEGMLQPPAYVGNIRTMEYSVVHSVTSWNDHLHGPQALVWIGAPSSVGTFGNTRTLALFDDHIVVLKPTELTLFRQGWWPVQVFEDILIKVREGKHDDAVNAYVDLMKCSKGDAEVAIKFAEITYKTSQKKKAIKHG